MVELNSASKRVTEQEKYPMLHLSDRDTGERCGLEYAEPGCCSVPLDWDKHRTQKRDEPATLVPLPLCRHPLLPKLNLQTQHPPSVRHHSPAPHPLDALSISHSLSAGALLKQDMPSVDIQEPPAAMEIVFTCLAPSNEVLTGERSHRAHKDRWTGFCVGPHTLDATHERSYQQLAAEVPWGEGHSEDCGSRLCRHEGSETAFVPVVTIEPAIVNPPAPAPPLSTSLTQGSIDKIVESILEKQQHQPEQKRRRTKTCFACGQPKSQYETDGPSIRFFHQQGPVCFFYCSKKVYQSYAAEGLSNPKMPFEEFFQKELEATKKRVEEKMQKKRKIPDTQQAGCLCRFCHMGMAKEMNWNEFQKSPYYEAVYSFSDFHFNSGQT
ncbi:hypothetical protein ABG768_027966 [Culter alburnus]|uniref:Uncharacterized protein n=1 Tax=Culter alburnus TaxID=194366 RepID=A0AAW2A893_CULAL